jgi:hypothetical protein
MGNGRKKAYVREKEYRYGKMEASTKGIGKMIVLMGMEDSFILTETAITVNGWTTKLTAEEPMNIWMVQNTSVIGKKINNMDTVSKHGQMKPSTKVITNSVKNMESVLLNGQINQLISENFTTIIFMEKVFTHGLMVENMKVNGEQIKCMGKELLVGLMEENTSDNMPKTRREVTENSFGQIDVVTDENG